MRRLHSISSSGFSLLEVMIACTLGLILLGAVGKVYLTAKEIYTRQNELSILQENVRFAAHIFTHDIRMAGFAGCATLGDLYLNNNYEEHPFANFNFSPATILIGFTKSTAPSYLQDKVIAGTEGIIIKKAGTATTQLAKSETGAMFSLVKVKRNPASESNRILLISDCTHADLFQTENIAESTIKVRHGNIKHNYHANDSEVSRFAELAYFVSDTKRIDSHGKKIYALFMTSNRGRKEEILAGIQNMQIHFGVKKNGKIDNYYSTAEMEKQSLWSYIQSVVISLTFNTESGKNKTFNFYITLRNR